MLIGRQCEGVHVDTSAGFGLHRLVRLGVVEVHARAHGKAVMTVELELSGVQGSQGIRRFIAGCRIASKVTVGIGVGKHPGQVLARMVQVETQVLGRLVVGEARGLIAGELHLSDQVLVRHLGEATTLIGVQVHVVHPEGDEHVAVGRVVDAGICHELGSGEGEVQFDLMVLHARTPPFGVFVRG